MFALKWHHGNAYRLYSIWSYKQLKKKMWNSAKMFIFILNSNNLLLLDSSLYPPHNTPIILLQCSEFFATHCSVLLHMKNFVGKLSAWFSLSAVTTFQLLANYMGPENDLCLNPIWIFYWNVILCVSERWLPSYDETWSEHVPALTEVN